VGAGRHRKAIGGVSRIGDASRHEGAHDVPVDQHLERLGAGVGGPLSGQEAESVRAGREGHGLADAAQVLQESNLSPFGSIRVAGGEDAAVAGHARGAGERPVGPARIVLVGRGAGPDGGRLEPTANAQRVRGRIEQDGCRPRYQGDAGDRRLRERSANVVPPCVQAARVERASTAASFKLERLAQVQGDRAVGGIDQHDAVLEIATVDAVPGIIGHRGGDGSDRRAEVDVVLRVVVRAGV